MLPPARLWQRLASGAFLSISLGVLIYFSYSLVMQAVRPERIIETPVGIRERAPVVASVEYGALQAEDRVLAINGVPYVGSRTLGEAEAASKPGDTMTFLVERGGHRMEPIAVVLRAIRPLSWQAQVLNFAFGGFLPLFAVSLAAVVLLWKPGDRLAWFLALLLVSFSYMISTATFWNLPRPLGILFAAFHSLARASWPFWLLLFGFYFPDRHPLDRRVPWLKWLVAVPLGVDAVLDVVRRLARYESYPLAETLAPVDAFRETPGFVLALLAVGLFFALTGYRLGTEKNRDAKRRLRLLMVGAYVTFTPLFLFLVYVIAATRFFTRPGSFSSDTPWVAATLFLTVPVFPLTLGYLVVVHRALDIRVVIRQGLQYALARRGVVILQAVATVAAILVAVFATGEASTPRRISAIALAITFVLAIRALGERLSRWIDRRFFRDAYQAEHVLTELSETVRTMVETRPLLETVTQRIAETLHIPRIAVLLSNGHGFQPAYALGYDPSPGFEFRRESVTVRELERTGAPVRVYLDDPASWVNRPTGPGGEERGKLLSLETQLLLPLRVKDRILGFLSLGPKRSEEPYSGADLRLLSSVASQTGLALENSRLAATIVEEAAGRERLNRELEIARDVQRRFFPQKQPAIAGLDYAGMCRPAQSVGGDFYDFRELPRGGFALAIGDVAGKGAPAALLMASLQASLRAMAMSASTDDLAARVGDLNTLICEITPASRFSTVFYGHYHPVSRRLTYVNAGHNPPLLVRAGMVRRLELSGPAIGLSRVSRYIERRVDLEPGDILACFTDGITEAMNAALEDFGDDRLTEVLLSCDSIPPSEILTRMLAAVDEFAAGAPQHDDITALVLRVV